MATVSRLNKIIGLFETNKPAFINISPPGIDSAIALSSSGYDGVMFEGEHRPFDMGVVRDSLQYLLDRKTIHEGGSLQSHVTPLLRIPANGGEMNQWMAKQALDMGVYGVVWPHVRTVEEAHNAVSACRYPRLSSAGRPGPLGERGDGPAAAARYWGISQQDYYRKADVWPLNPDGEILVVLMIEDVAGVDNLPQMLREVPGIGVILTGDGDLSQELGVPRKYDDPVVVEAKQKVVRVCKEHNVPAGHTRADAANVEKLMAAGYTALFSTWDVSAAGVTKGKVLGGRDK